MEKKKFHDQLLAMRCARRPVGLSTPAASPNPPDKCMRSVPSNQHPDKPYQLCKCTYFKQAH
jgi:hypothetical protein